MARITTIKKGESLDFVFDRGDKSINGFVCTLNVMQFKGDVPSISRVITPTGNEWAGTITSTEMATLTNAPKQNLWWAIGVLVDVTNDKEEQIADGSVRFTLGASWV